MATSREEELNEFKATGEKSSTADPVGDKTPKRRGDKDEGEKDYNYQGSNDVKKKLKNGKSKPSMMSDAVKLMGKMTEEELDALMNKLNGEEDLEESKKDNRVELEKITTDDIDVSEDVEALFKSDNDLSEDFKAQATSLFEAAVVGKVNEILENVYVDVQSDEEAVKESATNELTDRLDSYLDYVVNEWFEENRVAIEKGITAELSESFIKGLKNLFDEHYVSVPDEKVDVVEELVEKNAELEEAVDELTENNVDLFRKVKKFEQEQILDDVSEDLTASQRDKLVSLAEGISFKNATDYRSKLSLIKENYFGEEDESQSRDNTTLTEDKDHPLALDEEEQDTPAHMRGYLQAISRHAKGSSKK